MNRMDIDKSLAERADGHQLKICILLDNRGINTKELNTLVCTITEAIEDPDEIKTTRTGTYHLLRST